MFAEAALVAPTDVTPDRRLVVRLPVGHPGRLDLAYRAHRNRIAELAAAYRPGDPVPVVDYPDREHDLWRLVSARLAEQHRRYACAEILAAADRLDLPRSGVPQLGEVSGALETLTGFRLRPAAGLVPIGEFCEAFADGVFTGTQYLRHHSTPYFSPEPDLVHEVVGHGTALASDRFAALYRQVGQAMRRVGTPAAVRLLARVVWFTLEYGVLHERGKVKAYGASLLSSVAELDEFRRALLRPLDAAAMATQEYDISQYQPVLFCADSLQHVTDFLADFAARVDDETPARLGLAAREPHRPLDARTEPSP